MTTDAQTRPLRTADERRHDGVASLVAHVMSRPEGHRYASAYGILAGLVNSREPSMNGPWARDFAAAVDHAMTEHPFDHTAAHERIGS